jgi:hypothetical protein
VEVKKVTNALAYYETALIAALKSFIVGVPGKQFVVESSSWQQQTNPWSNPIKLFTAVIYYFL